MGVGPFDFSAISQNTLIDKPLKYRLDKWTARYTENWLNRWDQRAVISSDHPSCSLVISCVPQGSILGLTLFKSFINDWDYETRCTLSKFADTTQTVHKEKLRQLGLFSLKMGRLSRILSLCINA